MAGEVETESGQPTDILRNSKGINVERAALGIIDVDAKMTIYVILACTIAASGGLLFGTFGASFAMRASTLEVIFTIPLANRMLQPVRVRSYTQDACFYLSLCFITGAGYDGGCTGGVESMPQFARWW